MKLYYAPGACSLASHIALLEAGIKAEYERVDTRQKKTASGADFSAINKKGYVPALELDDGEILTESVAILDWIAAKSPMLGLEGALGRTRVIEALSFLATELHKPFRAYFVGGTDEEKAVARTIITGRLQLLAGRVGGDFAFGKKPTVVDFYLLVILLWADKFGIDVPAPLAIIRDHVLGRAATQQAMMAEGSSPPAIASNETAKMRKVGS